VSTVDPDEFAGQVALVTAAAGKGIGQAIARRLAAGGARVVVTDIHAARTRKVTAEIAADYPATTVAGYPTISCSAAITAAAVKGAPCLTM
jgi:NAD(P)-dependent dehydrogenase (short-subunit alcohol dehydrogenase family)